MTTGSMNDTQLTICIYIYGECIVDNGEYGKDIVYIHIQHVKAITVEMPYSGR